MADFSAQRPISVPDFHEALGMPIGYETFAQDPGEALPAESVNPNLIAGPWRPLNLTCFLVPAPAGLDGHPRFARADVWGWIRPLYRMPAVQEPSPSVQ